MLKRIGLTSLVVGLLLLAVLSGVAHASTTQAENGGNNTSASQPTSQPAQDAENSSVTQGTGDGLGGVVDGVVDFVMVDDSGDTCNGDTFTVELSNGQGECVPHYTYTVDDHTKVVGVDWSAGVFVVESDRVQRISLTDTNSIKHSGAGDVNYREATLDRGQNVVRFRMVDAGGDKTVTIGTSEALDYMSDPGKAFLQDGVDTNSVIAGSFAGGISIIAVGYGFYRLKTRKTERKWTNVLTDYKP